MPGTRYTDGMHETPGKLFAVMLGMVLWCGCTQPSPSPVPESLRVSDVQAALNDAFEASPVIRFRYCDGRWFGTDEDVDIALRQDGSAIWTHYGQAGAQDYQARYSVSQAELTITEGELILNDGARYSELADAPYKFGETKPLAVYRHDGDLLLLPVDGSGNRADSGWPYRQIDPFGRQILRESKLRSAKP